MSQENLTSTLKYIPRLLSLLDRSRFSATYGCFDRNYWQYRMVVDFPSSIYQQGVLSLTLIYKNNFEGNIYYGNRAVFEYICAGIAFWADIQNPDGSFNEWFPHEHSFVATAFTTYAISEALLLLEDEVSRLPEHKRKKIDCALKKAGRWLLKNNEFFVANHIAGAVAALHNLYLLTQEDSFRKGTGEKINQILSFQDEEGWFREYEGVDLGYLSVSLDYLAKYYKKTKDPILAEPLAKALNFLKYFIQPDGSCGGEYGSRNTKYLMPHGIRILAAEFVQASYVLGNMQEGMKKHVLPALGAVDDRYFVFFFLPNLLQYEFENQDKVVASVPPEEFTQVFANSGLISVRNEIFHFVCNAKKNGLLKIFSVKGIPGLAYSDSGYFAAWAGGRATSNYLKGGVFSVFGGGMEPLNIEIQASFAKMKPYTKYSMFLWFLRLFNFSLGRFRKISDFFATSLKKNFILKTQEAPFKLTRKIVLERARIIVQDKIEAAQKIRGLALRMEPNGQAQFSPTSGYFILSDLGAPEAGENLAGRLNDRGEVEITTQFLWLDGKMKMDRKIQ